MKRVFSHKEIGTQRYTGKADFYCRFILEKQLKDRTLWHKFVNVFSTREDVKDDGWRGEYFGKMMRGACITYQYAPDKELYQLLYETVRALLATQDEAGRITTYSADHQYCGWDLWVRKYVLVGCLYFYDICRDEAFKTEILSAMKRHADSILADIGEDKRSILDTSAWWGGINSSSLLEPIVELYKKTNEARYLAFAEYLIRQGGCKNGNLLSVVEQGKLLPHKYPTTKAYEMMSYFEGILAYAEVTNDEKLFILVKKFADIVYDNEVTIIGCAGCKSEQFNHSVKNETKPVPDMTIMQETCVTVTWMRLQERLLLDTGDARYAERMETSALNALYGAVNLYGEEQYCKEEKSHLPGVPFDSYSPLECQPRGIGIGGYKKFAEGGYYGCCACIGAAGTGLYPLSSVLRTKDGYAVLFYENGIISLETGGTIEIDYDPVAGNAAIRFDNVIDTTILFRIPTWANDTEATLNGVTLSLSASDYLAIDGAHTDDTLLLSFHPALYSVKRNGKIAIKYGPYVLARDEAKEKGNIAKRIVIPRGDVQYVIDDVCDNETIRLRLHTMKEDILLTDYASTGKHWNEARNRISVWHKIRRSLFRLGFDD